MNNITEIKTTQVIGKMLRETVEGTLKWNFLENTQNMGSNIDGYDSIVDHVYYTIINDKAIRLYKYKTKFFTDIDEWYWSIAYQLEFFDQTSNKTLWAFPSSNSITNLYNEVCFKASGADNFIDQYLK